MLEGQSPSLDASVGGILGWVAEGVGVGNATDGSGLLLSCFALEVH